MTLCLWHWGPQMCVAVHTCAQGKLLHAQNRRYSWIISLNPVHSFINITKPWLHSWETFLDLQQSWEAETLCTVLHWERSHMYSKRVSAFMTSSCINSSLPFPSSPSPRVHHRPLFSSPSETSSSIAQVRLLLCLWLVCCLRHLYISTFRAII